MATATKATKGFAITCPCCNDADATISLDLNDVRAITCSSCDETFSAAEAVEKVKDQLRRWEAVARWVEMAAAAIADPE